VTSIDGTEYVVSPLDSANGVYQNLFVRIGLTVARPDADPGLRIDHDQK
jgi:hypothetical protein